MIKSDLSPEKNQGKQIHLLPRLFATQFLPGGGSPIGTGQLAGLERGLRV